MSILVYFLCFHALVDCVIISNILVLLLVLNILGVTFR